MFLSLLKFQSQLSKASVTDSNLHLSPAVRRYRNCREVCDSSYSTCSTLVHASGVIDDEWVLVFQHSGELSYLFASTGFQGPCSAVLCSYLRRS